MGYCDTCVVRNSAICSILDKDEIATLSTMGRRRQLKAGESLAWEGDESVLVANVIEGVLQLTTGTEDGREQVVGIVFPSDFIGRPFGSTTNHSITAITDANVCVFGRADFDRFASERPALEHKLLKRTLGELDRTRQWMLLLSRKTAEERVASFLLDMSKRMGAATCEDGEDGEALDRFSLPFNRQQIGDILGLTIETVSRQLTKLKRNGIVDLPSRREIVIADRYMLEQLAG